MKVRKGFVSNSSSTSFVITNTSDVSKNLTDFVEENPQLLRDFNEQYNDSIEPDVFWESASEENMVWDPGEAKTCIFGDEQGTVVGRVFDYILRDGGRSKSFTWRFDEFLR